MTAPTPRAAEPWDELRKAAQAALPITTIRNKAVSVVEAFIHAASPAMVLSILRENDALRAHVAALTAERDAAREALQVACDWHEAEDRTLSKNPQIGHVPWRRQQHREQIEAMSAALSQPASGAMEAKGDGH